MKKLLFLSAVILLHVIKLNAQNNPDSTACFGGTENEDCKQTIKLSDGTFTTVGSSNSTGSGHVTSNNGGIDAWQFNVDSNLNLRTSNVYGGAKTDLFYEVSESPDGFLYSVGQTFSDCDSMPSPAGDAYLVKTDLSGNIVWDTCIGGSNIDIGRAVVATADSGCVIIVNTRSSDGAVPSANKGSYDLWFVKFSKDGQIIWSYTYGGSGNDQGLAVLEYNDLIYFSGLTGSPNNGDITGHAGSYDGLLGCLNASGDSLIWIDAFGGTGDDRFYSLELTRDGMLIASGSAKSTNGDILTSEVNGDADLWLAKFNTAGVKQWSRVHGGTKFDQSFHAREVSGDSIILTGRSYSSNVDIPGNNGNYDLIVVMCNSNGDLLWALNFGGSRADYGRSVNEIKPGHYLITGVTSSGSIPSASINCNHGSTNTSDCFFIQINGSTVSPVSGSPLPIELIYFGLKAQESSVNVRWATLSEIDNDYFEIQRSVDAIFWETLTRINGCGTCNYQNTYEYNDPSPLAGTSYYRLSWTDINGISQNSSAEAITINSDPNKVEIYYHDGSLHINSSIKIATIKVISSDGRVILKKDIPGQEQINVSHLKKGLFVVDFSTRAGLINKRLKFLNQ